MLLYPTWNNLRLKVLLALIIEMIFSSRKWPIISITLLNTTESIWSCSISKFSCTPFEPRANLLSVWAYLITLLELLINWYSKSSQLLYEFYHILSFLTVSSIIMFSCICFSLVCCSFLNLSISSLCCLIWLLRLSFYLSNKIISAFLLLWCVSLPWSWSRARTIQCSSAVYPSSWCFVPLKVQSFSLRTRSDGTIWY